MYDYSFNVQTLGRRLRKSDFNGVLGPNMVAFRSATLDAAVKSATSIFNGTNPVSSFHLKKKTIYRLPKLEDELVLRKLSADLKHASKTSNRGRAFIVKNLALLLEEGVPYRLYRFDVKNFYESFDAQAVKEKLANFSQLSPLGQRIFSSFYEYYVAIGGKGVPRGLGISAVLSDLMMTSFDKKAASQSTVYFFARYVDDIVIITNASENAVEFIQLIDNILPDGLALNGAKQKVVEDLKRVESIKAKDAPAPVRFSIDYLGYQFGVYDPIKKKNEKDFRQVVVDMAKAKVKKTKSRIVRSFLDFKNSGDWSLLLDRMKFLTSNFSVYDVNKGNRKLAGIYHSYPQVSDDSPSLIELDYFLKNAVLSKNGRVFSKTSPLLSSWQKRKLLSQSFKRGHSEKIFVYFSPAKIGEIQECWINE